MEYYRRLEDKLSSFWQKVANDDEVPAEALIDPDSLEEIWDDCFLVEVTPENLYRYDYLGKNLIAAYDEFFYEDEVETLISPESHQVVEKFEEVINTKKPVSDTGEFCDSKKLTIKYRQYLLPFSDSEGEVKYILGGMKWAAS